MNISRFTSGVFALLLLCSVPLAARASYDSLAAVKLGRNLFETHCSPCHGVHQEIVGPMLASITRKRSQPWLIRFIRDSQSVIVSGDAYAAFLFASYNQQVMPSFRMLTDGDIQAILRYIETESLTQVDETAGYTLLNEESNESILRGHTIFRNQCSSCHFIHYEGWYAPALGSVSRRHPRAWLHAFIRNSQQVIKGGDVYAADLFKVYHNRVMVPMAFLTEKEIDDVLQYITFSSASPSAQGGVNGRKVHALQPDTKAAQAPVEAYQPVGKPFFKILFIVISGMVAVLYSVLLVRFFRYLHKG